jgi:hypothetical protein
MTLTSTDAGAAAAPLLDLYRDSASPAAADTLGEIEFNGEDSAGNKQTYGLIHGSILSPTSGAEQGQLHFETATAGALTEKMIIGTTNLVINEIGGIFNVRIEGDTDANLFYTDATNSRVGIGLIAPAEKLDVLGNAKVSGRATIDTLTIGLGGQTTVASNTALGYQALNSASLTGTANVGVGYQALRDNTTGSNLTAVGYAALLSNTTGAGNSALGASALIDNTTGADNTAVGVNALFSNSTASQGTAVGREALRYFNTANNTAVGYAALTGSSTVANNTGNTLTAVGYLALTKNTTGSNNVAVGRALENNTTGGSNIAVGNSSLGTNTTGTGNVAVGGTSLFNTTTGDINTAVGGNALRENVTGSASTAVGADALYRFVSAGNQVAIGYRALYGGDATPANNTGATNIGIGYLAGDVITTGSRNTIIGANSDPSAAAGVDQTVVGEGLTGKGDDTAFIGGTNGAYNEKNVTTWETTSDQRIKKNIVSNNVGLEVISQIDVRNFEYRTAEEITDLPASAAIDQSGVQLGVIAQELQAVLPNCVTENSTGVLSINTDQLIWYLVNSVKQLSAKVAELEGA